jgi:hypothetical protein
VVVFDIGLDEGIGEFSLVECSKTVSLWLEKAL